MRKLLMAAALGIASIWGQVTPLGTLRGRLTVDDKIKAIVPDKILLYGTNQQDMHTWVAEKNEVFTERGRGAGLWSISAPQLNLCAGGVEAKLPVNSNAEPSGNAPARKIILKPCGPAFGFALRRPRFRFVRTQFFPAGEGPAAELSGSVSDQHGGLSGARVGWYGRYEDHGIRLINSVRTGSSGSFDLKRKTVASYESYLLIVSHPNYAPAVLSAGANGRIAGESGDQIGTLILKSLSGSAPGAPDVVPAEPMHRYVFRGALLNQLPLRGFRSFDDVALLLPGVAPAPQTGHSAGAGIAPGIGTAGSFSVNGLPARQNDFNVDGSDNNDEEVGARRQGYVSLTPQSTQSIEELQIVTALPDVRLGRGAAGHVNALTLGGRLGFHLDSHGFLSDSRLNARDFFETRPEPSTGFTASHARYPSTRGQAGVVAGGTVPGAERLTGENLFYSFSFTEQSLRSTQQYHFAVPRADERIIPAADRAPLNSLLEPRALSPVGEAVFSLYPFPNNPSGPYGANSYTTELPQDSNSRLYSLKLDKPFHTGSIEHRVTARFNRSLESSVVPVTRDALYSSVRPYFGTTNVAGYFTTNFSSRLLNSFRSSYGTTSGHFLERRDPRLLGSTLLRDVSFLLNADVVKRDLSSPAVSYTRTNQKTEDLLGFLGSVNVAGFSPLGVDVARFPQKRQDETYQFGDLLTFSSGAHVISAGVDVRDIRLNSASEPNARPAIEFHGLRTPDLAGFVPVAPRVFSAASLAAAGIPAGVYHTLAFNGAVTGNPIAYTPLSLAQRHWDAYVQEQWRATSRLTLTAGIRAGRNGLPRDADNRILRGFDARQLADLAAKAINDPNPPVSCRTLPPPGCGDVPAIFARQFPPDFPDAFGQRSTVADPRIGFAVTLNDGATVVRGGWGKQTAQFPAILITESQSAFPDYLPLNIAGYDPGVLTSFGNRAYNEGFRFAYPRTSSGVVAPGTANVIDRSGIALDPINLLVFKLQAPALDSVQPSFRLKSAYSLQQAVSLDHQFTERLSASLAYVGTFGRNLLRATTPDGGFARAAVIPSGVPDRNGSPGFYPQLAAAQLRASDLFSLAKLVYEGSGTSSYHSLQTTMRIQTRRGTTVFTALTYSHAIDNVTDLFDTAGAPALPQDSARRSERGSASFDQRLRVATHLVWQAPEQAWVFKRLELALIHIHSTGQPYTVNSAIDNNRDGNLTDRPPNASGRNMFRGPSSDALDFSLGRTFRFRDGRHLVQPRIEVFNALNRAELALPVRVAESPGFGSSVRTIAPARIIQAGLRYSF